jgi:hypothetical protein
MLSAHLEAEPGTKALNKAVMVLKKLQQNANQEP